MVDVNIIGDLNKSSQLEGEISTPQQIITELNYGTFNGELNQKLQLRGKINATRQLSGGLNQPIMPWTNDHSQLSHLDYASSGHTGFTSATDFSAFAIGLPESAKSGKYTDLIEKPKINGVELVGNKTSSELNIIVDKTFVYFQQVASKTWDITHNLDKFCSVTVVDSSGTVVVGDISYKSTNRVVIDFGGSFSGEAYLN